jgi:hypothetical protein
MERWCEIYADARGRLVIVFREILGNDPAGVVYCHYTSPLPPFDPSFEKALEASYSTSGPFGERSGSIPRLRVVS